MINVHIDEREILRLRDTLGASDTQVQRAFNRALNRTAATLRKQSNSALKSELQLKNLKGLRKRLRQFKKARGGELSVKLWYGTNDMPIQYLKGKATQNARGITFREQQFLGAFFGKNKKGQRVVFKRKGKARLPIKTEKYPVQEKMQNTIEKKVFKGVDAIFYKHFKADLKARTIYGVGNGR